MPPSRVTTRPRPTRRRSKRFCLALPRWASDARVLVESMKDAKLVMSSAREEMSSSNAVTARSAIRRSISASAGASSWRVASQCRRLSKAAGGTSSSRSPAVPAYQSAKALLEQGSTTRFSVARAR